MHLCSKSNLFRLRSEQVLCHLDHLFQVLCRSSRVALLLLVLREGGPQQGVLSKGVKGSSARGPQQGGQGVLSKGSSARGPQQGGQGVLSKGSSARGP